MENDNKVFRIPDYAELKDPPPRQSLLQMGLSPEGVKSGSVSRAKFDLVKDKLKQVQVSLHQTDEHFRQQVDHYIGLKCVSLCQP